MKIQAILRGVPIADTVASKAAILTVARCLSCSAPTVMVMVHIWRHIFRQSADFFKFVEYTYNSSAPFSTVHVGLIYCTGTGTGKILMGPLDLVGLPNDMGASAFENSTGSSLDFSFTH